MAEGSDYAISATTESYNSTTKDPHSIFYWNELIPTLVVYGTTFVLGLTGNCLIILTTFRYRRMQSVTNVFLSSLACSDLLLITICIPVKVAKLFSYTWEMGFFICKSVHYMQNVSAICSVLTLTAISIERYYAIVHPMRAKYICTISQAKRVILVIWVKSFLLAVPTLIVQVHLPVGLNDEYFWCVKNFDWGLIWRFHEVYMLFVILICPFCVMTFSYTLICWEVWKVMERRSPFAQSHGRRREVLGEHPIDGRQAAEDQERAGRHEDGQAGDLHAGRGGHPVRGLLGARPDRRRPDGVRRPAAPAVRPAAVHVDRVHPDGVLQQLHQPDRVRVHVEELPRELRPGAVLLVGRPSAPGQQLQSALRLAHGLADEEHLDQMKPAVDDHENVVATILIQQYFQSINNKTVLRSVIRY